MQIELIKWNHLVWLFLFCFLSSCCLTLDLGGPDQSIRHNARLSVSLFRAASQSISGGLCVGLAGRQQTWQQGLGPGPLRRQSQADVAPVGAARVDQPELPVQRLHGPQELPLEGLAEGDVQEGGDAAVGVAHADSDVVGIGEGCAGLLHPQVHQLQDVVRGPAGEEGQADGHGHAGHLPGPQPEAAGGQGSHAGGHVLQDLEEHQADDGQWQRKSQEELIECEPVGGSGGVGQQQCAARQSTGQRHQAHVHPHRDDGDQGQRPHQPDDQRGRARRADVVEADGMHRGEVAVQGHGGQDVRADDLTVGVQHRDDGAHGGPEVPGAVAQELVDQEGHAQEEEQVHDGQVEDEDVGDGLLGAAFGLLQDGVDHHAVPQDAQEADDAVNGREDGAALQGRFYN